MTVFSGEEAVEEFLEEFDGWLSESVEVYLLGGSALTVRGLQDQTEDIDLALGIAAHFEHVRQTVRNRGFEVVHEPTKSFEGVGRTLELRHPKRGLHLDLFERQIVGKVWLSERMRERAAEFWTGERVTAYVLSDEDMFLLKAVSGGDVGNRGRSELEALRKYAQRGIEYDVVLEEIRKQRPFNTGATEAKQIRERSHPLFSIEIAVRSISGLPRSFTDSVAAFATEFEVEYFVLRSVEDGTHDVDAIRERVLSNVQSLSADEKEEIDASIERLVQKRILERNGTTVHRN